VKEPKGGVRVEDVDGDAGVKVETLKKKNIQRLIFKKINKMVQERKDHF
jgi:hypothetical protein